MSKVKIYAVTIGRVPGIYQTWKDAEEQIYMFPGAKYKAFKTMEEAETYITLSQKESCKQHESIEIVQENCPPGTNNLSSEQSAAVDMVMSGCNILLTGEAGTGKSHVVREVIRRAQFAGWTIGVTATTGAAALLIGGRTFHSFLGLGLGKDSAEKIAGALRKDARGRLRKLKLLIVDEISMLNAELLDKACSVLRIIRGCDKPFGGVQMLMCGDFCQLPPVQGSYCFLSDSWKAANIVPVVLKTVMRQKDDEEFRGILQRARWGRVTKVDVKRLRELANNDFNKETKDDTLKKKRLRIIPTRLYSYNMDVDAINAMELDRLIEKNRRKGREPTVYPFLPACTSSEKWAKGVGIAERLTLCKGAQVVLTRNLDVEAGLVNGARGVVKACDDEYVTVQFADAGLVQIGYIVDTCILEEQPNFREDISDVPKNSPEDVPDTDPDTTALIKKLVLDDAKKRKTHKMKELEVKYIPLKLAWAISIHKSQGMTLDAVEVDLGDTIFASGQAYTALSRARDLKSMRIVDVSMKSFKTSRIVTDFYNECNT